MALNPDVTPLRHVDISGATLASILHDVVIADRDVDGLLFGRMAQKLVSLPLLRFVYCTIKLYGW
jgi:hypothetical protein